MITNQEIHTNLAALRALHLVLASAHQRDDGRHHVACYPSRVLPDRRAGSDTLIRWRDKVALISYKSTKREQVPAPSDFYVIPMARVLPTFRATIPDRTADGGWDTRVSGNAFTVGKVESLTVSPLNVVACHGSQPLPQAILTESLSWKPGVSREKLEALLDELAAAL